MIKCTFRCGLLALLLLTSTTGTAEPLNHVVLVWLKDPANEAQVQEIIDNADVLATIPSVLAVSAGRPVPSDREMVDDSFSAGINIVLRSPEAILGYLQHPVHVDYLDRFVKGKAARIQIYDFSSTRQAHYVGSGD